MSLQALKIHHSFVLRLKQCRTESPDTGLDSQLLLGSVQRVGLPPGYLCT